MSRTGTFLTIQSQVERLKVEGVVDVFQAVKSARLHRAGLVSNAVSAASVVDMCFHTYIFCHNTLILKILPHYSFICTLYTRRSVYISIILGPNINFTFTDAPNFSGSLCILL